MLNEYLSGAIPQMIERGRELIAKIPRNLPRDYDTLSLTCRNQINHLISQLNYIHEQLADNTYQAERLRSFKRIVADMDFIETIGVTALDRALDEDHKLNVLLEKIAREIGYPRSIPVVTTLSQQYFCIYPELNLLCVPLTEGKFLLHLPDLYHELAHPIFKDENDPMVEPFQHKFWESLLNVLSHIEIEKVKEQRRRGPQHFYDLLCCWEDAWARFWLEEFFCDLFGIYTLGPAFAWAHIHLVLKRGGNPFYVPKLRATTHPADDARMRVMIYALRNAKFQQEADLIHKSWQLLLIQIDAKPDPEYHRCYPDAVLEIIAQNARCAVEGIKCRIATPQTQGAVHSILNQAWTKFWQNPIGYVEWEKQTIASLLGN